MKIIRLQSENVKKIKAVEIKPDGNVVVISGPNASGKTSVLDSIEMGLTGNLPVKPIREGEDKAAIILDLGDYVVKRTFKRKQGGGFNRYLAIESKDGQPVAAPQAMLDKVVGKISMDPLKFATMEKAAQRKLLMQLAGLDFAKQDGERARLYEDRTIINRELKNLEGQVSGFNPEEFKDAPESRVHVRELMEESQHLDKIVKEAMLHGEELVKLEEETRALRKALADAEKAEEVTHLQVIKHGVPATKARQRLSEVNQQMIDADFINRKVNLKNNYTEARAILAAKQKESERITGQLESLDTAKTQAIRSAKMPIAGLAFDADGVLYNGTPFDDLSSAEKLKVSLAMAMEMNPDLRVIRITDGSLLDSGNMAVIQQMAKDQDYQVWIEQVDESGKVGIYIEDGQVCAGGGQGERE